MNSQKVTETHISHSGESRNPVILSSFNLLDPGFRRGDDFFRVHLCLFQKPLA